MATEAQIYEAAAVNHVVDGAAISDNAFSITSDIDNVVDNSALKYPYAKITLVINDLSAAPSAGKTIDVYRRGINLVSSISEPEPDSNYKSKFIDSFIIDAVDPGGSDVAYIIMDVPLLPHQQSFYLHNNLGVTVSANWDLYVTPYTFKAAT
jgi:hypothetical protein